MSTPFTIEELEMLAQLEEQAIADMERTNWTNEPLTETEKQLIGMTVSWTYRKFKEGLNRADD